MSIGQFNNIDPDSNLVSSTDRIQETTPVLPTESVSVVIDKNVDKITLTHILSVINQRYASAAIELGARIQSRQNTVNTFAAVVFTFIGVFFKFAYDAHTISLLNVDLSTLILENYVSLSDQDKQLVDSIHVATFAAMCVTVIGLVFSSWVSFQAVKIQTLHNYLNELERISEVEYGMPKIGKTWHDIKGGGWFEETIGFRRLNNAAYIATLLLTTAPALVLSLAMSWMMCIVTLGAASIIVSFIAGYLNLKEESKGKGIKVIIGICIAILIGTIVTGMMIFIMFSLGWIKRSMFSVVHLFCVIAFFCSLISIVIYWYSEFHFLKKLKGMK